MIVLSLSSKFLIIFNYYFFPLPLLFHPFNFAFQLDFNGRVTQESAKNFQIEYQSKQVLQFGRIENGAYTLDFREPFSAVQAFAIALASITQRLK